MGCSTLRCVAIYPNVNKMVAVVFGLCSAMLVGELRCLARMRLGLGYRGRWDRNVIQHVAVAVLHRKFSYH